MVVVVVMVAKDRRAGRAFPGGSLRSHGFDRQNASALLRKFGPCLSVGIKEREVAHDHRNGQGNRQYPGDGAEGADQHAHVSLRGHVPVAHRRHGYDGPPQADRDGPKVVLFVDLAPLGVVDERGEDDHADDEEEDEEAEFVGTGLERVDKNLEAGRVTGQLEEAHDSYDVDEVEGIVLEAESHGQDVHVEGQGSQKVDHVDRGADELEPIRTDHQTHQELEREPGVADALDKV